MTKLSPSHAQVEAILFLENAFISQQALAHKVGLSVEKVAKIVTELNSHYKTFGHSLLILIEENNYLLAITQGLSKSLSHLYNVKNQQKLSKALLETIAVIAYSQPITKPEIDEIRGVNSEGALKILKSQNLIKHLGKKAVPGSPNQYGTTNHFLKVFGLKSIKDLPKLKESDLMKFDNFQNKNKNKEDFDNNEKYKEEYDLTKDHAKDTISGLSISTSLHTSKDTSADKKKN